MTTSRHSAVSNAGALVREWRQRRRLSQLELSMRADVSTRHISYVESGKSQPSREMLLNLAEHLDIPLRECNQLLLAGGFAPKYTGDRIDDDRLEIVRNVVRTVLRGHEPNPAFAIDRRWNLVDANGAAQALFANVDPDLLAGPVNIARVSLHPRGLARQIINLGECRAHLLRRLQRELTATGDEALRELRDEVMSYRYDRPLEDVESHDFALPVRLRTSEGEQAYVSTITTFGTPRDIAVEELVIESFYPI